MDEQEPEISEAAFNLASELHLLATVRHAKEQMLAIHRGWRPKAILINPPSLAELLAIDKALAAAKQAGE
jgi:hypothetical protein